MFEVIAAESRIQVHFVGKVEVTGLQVTGEGAGLANFLEHGVKPLTLQQRLFGDGDDGTVDADLWRLAFREMEVGSFAVD